MGLSHWCSPSMTKGPLPFNFVLEESIAYWWIFLSGLLPVIINTKRHNHTSFFFQRILYSSSCKTVLYGNAEVKLLFTAFVSIEHLQPNYISEFSLYLRAKDNACSLRLTFRWRIINRIKSRLLWWTHILLSPWVLCLTLPLWFQIGYSLSLKHFK